MADARGRIAASPIRQGEAFIDKFKVGNRFMLNTKDWAFLLGVCVTDNVPSASDDHEPLNRTAADVAVRVIVLHCIAAAGYGVDSQRVVAWLKDQKLWEMASPRERAFLCSKSRSDKELTNARWRQEAQWALLWAIGKVTGLGLPTKTCDTRTLVEEIMPELGDSIDPFVSSAGLRSPPEVLAEDDRIYNLHCYAHKAHREGTMPADLVYNVLYQRRYAFEWLTCDEDWDDVSTDT